jgi:glycosyltransferase involved in cell wall biosynthesis
VTLLNKFKKILVIKFGDTVEEFKQFSYQEKNEEDVYSPTWDYIPQFFHELKDYHNYFKTYWIGVGIKQNKSLKNNNNWFLTYKNFTNIKILYLLYKIKPDLIINISGQKSLSSLYLYKLIKKKTKILQFIAGEYSNNLLSIFFYSLLKKSEKIYVMNNQTKIFLEKKIKKEINIFVPFYNKEFLEPNKKVPPINKNKFNIFYCGRFSKIKGIWDLFDIIKKMKNENIVFHLIGEGGNEYSEFKEKITKNGLDESVKFYGFIPNFLLSNYMKQADIGIIPSKSEGYCQVAEEFLMSNIPILATKVGGLIDRIEEGKNGYLIDKENKIEQFIKKIIFLKNNPDKIKQLKKNINPSDYFNRENVFGKIIKNYYLYENKKKEIKE